MPPPAMITRIGRPAGRTGVRAGLGWLFRSMVAP
jgi:hypothetical protein